MERVKGILLLIAIVLLSLGMCYITYDDDYMWKISAIAYSHKADFITYMIVGNGYAMFLIFAAMMLFCSTLIYLMMQDLKNESTAS
jgi:hypothetical protein